MLSKSCLTKLQALVFDAQLALEIFADIEHGQNPHELSEQLRLQSEELSALIRRVIGSRVTDHGLPYWALDASDEVFSWLTYNSSCWRGKVDLKSCSSKIRVADHADEVQMSRRLEPITSTQIWMLKSSSKVSKPSAQRQLDEPFPQSQAFDSGSELGQLYEEKLEELTGKLMKERHYPSSTRSQSEMHAYTSGRTRTLPGEVTSGSTYVCDNNGGVIGASAKAIEHTRIYSHLQGAPLLWISIEAQDCLRLQKRIQSLTASCSSIHENPPKFISSLSQLEQWDINFSTKSQTAGQILAWPASTVAFAVKLGSCIVHQRTVNRTINAQQAKSQASTTRAALPHSSQKNVPSVETSPTRPTLSSHRRPQAKTQAHSSKEEGRAHRESCNATKRVATRSAPARVTLHSDLESSTDDETDTDVSAQQLTENNSDCDSASITSNELMNTASLVRRAPSSNPDANESELQAAETLVQFQHSHSPQSAHRTPVVEACPGGHESTEYQSPGTSHSSDSASLVSSLARNQTPSGFDSALLTPPHTAEKPRQRPDQFSRKRAFKEMLLPDDTDGIQTASTAVLIKASDLDPQWKTIFTEATRQGMKAVDAYNAIKLALAIGSPSVLAQLAELCQVGNDTAIMQHESVENEFRGYVHAQNGKAHMECKSHIHARILYEYYMKREQEWKAKAKSKEAARSHTLSIYDAVAAKPKSVGRALDDLTAACLGIPREDEEAIVNYRRRTTRLRDHGQRVYLFQKHLLDALNEMSTSRRGTTRFDKSLSLLALLPLRPVTSRLDGTTVRPTDYWNLKDEQYVVCAKVLIGREHFHTLAGRASTLESSLLKGLRPAMQLTCGLLTTEPSIIAKADADSKFLRDLFEI